MSRVLITGGTGLLGRKLRPRLVAAGHHVRIMSRRSPRPGEDEGIEWSQAQLVTGEGLAEAVEGVDTIIHAASSPTDRQVDVGGTERLLQAAEAASVGHLLYISIVGIDQIPFGYYKNKLAAEELIQEAGVPWTIQRATQFHGFIDIVLGGLMRYPLALVPTHFKVQSISSREVADVLVQAAQAGPSGRMPDIGGPELKSLGEMARLWKKAKGVRRLVLRLPLPGKVAAGFRRGLNTVPDNRAGQLTWAAWLAERYGQPA